jgi:hypothetical protein
MRAWVILQKSTPMLGGCANLFAPLRADDRRVASNPIFESTVHWRKVGDAGRTRFHFGAKMLK